MIKVCSLSISFPMNREVIHLLREEMIRLAEADKHLEFWFSGCHDSFSEKAVQFISEIRDVLSMNQIDIVAVSDPLWTQIKTEPRFSFGNTEAHNVTSK